MCLPRVSVLLVSLACLSFMSVCAGVYFDSVPHVCVFVRLT